MPEHIILLHGIWNNGPMLWPLAIRLKRRGYRVEIFSYSSLREGAFVAAQRLSERIRQRQQESSVPIHLVGHSLGGMVCLLAAHNTQLAIGRIVCLGSPLNGSASARAVRNAGLAFGLGNSADVLLKGFEHAPIDRQIGVIAGTRAVGVGRLFRAMRGPSDGTVSVAETQLAGITAHICTPVSHVELVISETVADLTQRFLQTGRFC